MQIASFKVGRFSQRVRCRETNDIDPPLLLQRFIAGSQQKSVNHHLSLLLKFIFLCVSIMSEKEAELENQMRPGVKLIRVAFELKLFLVCT